MLVVKGQRSIVQRKAYGFTLVELLVVIAVISILASVVLIGLSGVRSRARDGRRIDDLHNVQNGLELFFVSCGRYPSATDWIELSAYLIEPTLDSSACAGGPDSINISQMPDDPLSGEHYLYGVNVSGNRYILAAELEDKSNKVLLDDIDGPQVDFGAPPLNCGAPGNDTVYCITL